MTIFVTITLLFAFVVVNVGVAATVPKGLTFYSNGASVLDIPLSRWPGIVDTVFGCYTAPRKPDAVLGAYTSWFWTASALSITNGPIAFATSLGDVQVFSPCDAFSILFVEFAVCADCRRIRNQPVAVDTANRCLYEVSDPLAYFFVAWIQTQTYNFVQLWSDWTVR